MLTLDYQTFEEEESIVAQITGLTDTLLIREAVFLTRSTRSHPLVRRGASVRAAASLALIAANLGGKDFLNRAAELALPTRIEFKRRSGGRSAGEPVSILGGRGQKKSAEVGAQPQAEDCDSTTGG